MIIIYKMGIEKRNPEEMHRIWNELWLREEFDKNTEESKISKRLRDALITIYEKNLNNTVLAEILDCEPWKTKRPFNYREANLIPNKIVTILWLDKNYSIRLILETLWTTENINTLLNKAHKEGWNAWRFYGNKTFKQ